MKLFVINGMWYVIYAIHYNILMNYSSDNTTRINVTEHYDKKQIISSTLLFTYRTFKHHYVWCNIMPRGDANNSIIYI